MWAWGNCHGVEQSEGARAHWQLVMKEGAWKMGNTTSTVLIDKEEEIIATRETTKEKEVLGTSRYE